MIYLKKAPSVNGLSSFKGSVIYYQKISVVELDVYELVPGERQIVFFANVYVEPGEIVSVIYAAPVVRRGEHEYHFVEIVYGFAYPESSRVFSGLACELEVLRPERYHPDVLVGIMPDNRVPVDSFYMVLVYVLGMGEIPVACENSALVRRRIPEKALFVAIAVLFAVGYDSDIVAVIMSR